MKLFNSRTRKIEEFESLTLGEIKMYSCGPTVYDYAHIGNLRAFIFADILRKSLELQNYKVTQVMNITDFGHLVGDGDNGEDKMSEGLKRENLPRSLEGMKTLADKYTTSFLDDINKLNIKKADFYPRASENISEYIKIISGLSEKGFTYKISDGIYFNTSKDPHYGYMSLLDKHNKSESRIGENSEKINQADFALWKFADSTDTGFDSPFGFGFPGWHIECSGMALKFLGEQIDIHTGGVDHINVHHTNEIAQTENFTGKTFSTFFCHNEFLDINDIKMSKSKNNFFTLRNIEEKNISPLAFRYLTLTANYRQKLNFTWENLQASATALTKLHIKVKAFKEQNLEPKINEDYKSKFLEKINNDLNTAQALALIWTLLKDKVVSDGEKLGTILYFDNVFSLGL